LVVILVAAGLGFIALEYWRLGLALIGAAMIIGGVLRWVLAEPGILVVRSKAIDVPVYLGLGVAIIVVDAIATLTW
jgi:hypothetical protein